MQFWMTLTLAVQLLSALTMIGLVLIQHGKGADMGASFGSGASSRSTAALATVFFVCTLALAYMGSTTSNRPEATGSSVLDRPAGGASAPATGAIPAAAPGAIPTPTTPVPAAPEAAASK